MLESLLKIIKKYVNDKNIEITPDTLLLVELGLNSFELVQIICDIEDEFDVEVPDRAISKLKTVKDVVNLIEGKE